MLIKQFCAATGLPRDTVRFYVKRGLLQPAIGSRTGNRYQVFDDTQVERARLIKAAQGLGFSLRQIAELARSYEADALDVPERALVLRAQLAQIVEREKQLKQMRKYLEAKLNWLEGGSVGPQPNLAGTQKKGLVASGRA